MFPIYSEVWQCCYLAHPMLNTNNGSIVQFLQTFKLFLCWSEINIFIDEILLDMVSLQWRHNDLDGVSNHQPHGCLVDCLYRRRSKKTSKLCVTGLCAGNSPVTGEFPAHRASNAEDVPIWWRHHVCLYKLRISESICFLSSHQCSRTHNALFPLTVSKRLQCVNIFFQI